MIKGSIPALVTPFKNGELDLDTLKHLVEWHIEQGSTGLVPVGTTGESPTLSHEEHETVVAEVVKYARGRVPVIAGAGSNNTAEGIRLIQHAERVGADAALVVTPYYNKPTQAGLIAHFTALHDCCTLPIIIYNIPGRSVVDMTPETMGTLAKLPRIIGVKDATGKIERVSQQRAACGPDFIQLSGEDATALGFNAHGMHRLHQRDRQCRAQAVRRVPGGDAGGRLCERAALSRPSDAAARGDLPRAGAGRGQVRALAPRTLLARSAAAPRRPD